MKTTFFIVTLLLTEIFMLLNFNSKAQTPSFLWAKGSSGGWTVNSKSVTVDANGNTYVVGTFEGPSVTFGTTTLTIPGGASTGYTDMFIVKYNALGSVQWAKMAGGGQPDGPNAVTVDANGNVYVVGYFESNTITFGATNLANVTGSASYYDMFIVKYDASGNVLWAKREGGNGDDKANSVKVDTSGNVFIAGYFTSPSITFGSIVLNNAGSGSSDMFIVKYDASGNVLWAKSSGGGAQDEAKSVTVDTMGNSYMVGYFRNSQITFGSTTLNSDGNGNYNMFIVKYDASGNPLWAKSAGGTDDDDAKSVTVDANGHACVVGSFMSSSITFGSFTLTNDSASGGTNDIFISKYDDSGNVLWAKRAGGTDEDYVRTVSVDINNYIYVGGSFQSASIILGSTTLTNTGGSGINNPSMFIVKYDALGNMIWAKGENGSLNSNKRNIIESIAIDTSSTIYLAGSYGGPSVTFGTRTLNNVSAGYEMFIVKIGNQGIPSISVSASPSNQGSVSGGGTHIYGTIANVIATANSGYIFTNWTENGNPVSTNSSYTFTVTTSRTLVANFITTASALTVSVTANPTNDGTVSGGGNFSSSSEANIIAIANPGYIFINWMENGNVVSTFSIYTFTVTSNRTIVANFLPSINLSKQRLACGGDHSFYICNYDSVNIWGNNSAGQLGNGTINDSPIPVRVSGLIGCIKIEGGQYHTIALKNDGTVWAWGWNNYGEIGDGTTTQKNTPVQVSGLSGITGIFAGSKHSLALKNDGTVWAWGDNTSGQLGDGTTTERHTPVQVNGLTNIVAISAGSTHSLALKSDGTVWGWGNNGWGQLVVSTGSNYTPVQMTGVADIIAIAGGENHSLLLKKDSTVWACGINNNGELGDGTTNYSFTPVKVIGINGITAIASGMSHSLALKSDGTISAWGLNGNGQLGDNTSTNTSTPVQVVGLTGIISIAAGPAHSIAQTNDGTLKSWGLNASGQLGDGTNFINRHIPIQVMGLCTSALPVSNCFVNYTTLFDTLQNTFMLIVDSTTVAIANSYYWDFGDGTTSSLATPTHTYTIDTVYNVCLKIKTASNDSCSYCNIIGKDYLGNIYRTSGFTINVINSNFQTGATTLLSNENSFIVFPNPTNGETEIIFNRFMNNISIKIFNIAGQKIFEKTSISGNHFNIDISNQSAGVYLIEILSDNGVLRRKLIKQ